jgi:hypothetical protein
MAEGRIDAGARPERRKSAARQVQIGTPRSPSCSERMPRCAGRATRICALFA